MKKENKLIAWLSIVDRGTAPLLFEKWTDTDNIILLKAQSDIVKMAHTALGHLEVMKKKEVVLAMLTMTQEEFNKFCRQESFDWRVVWEQSPQL